MGKNIRLDPRGLEEAATTAAMHSAVREVADRVARNVEAQAVRVQGKPGDVALPVKVYEDTTERMRINRAQARVVLAHPAGLAAQAKHGLLTKAAAAAGLKVKPKRG